MCRSNQYKTIGFWATKSIEKVSKIQGKINSTINTNTKNHPAKTMFYFCFYCHDLHALHAADLWARPARWKKTCFYVHAADLWTRPARVKHATRPVQIHACSKPLGKACQGETKDNYIHIFSHVANLWARLARVHHATPTLLLVKPLVHHALLARTLFINAAFGVKIWSC